MAKQSVGVWFAVLVCCAILVSQAVASTDSRDVKALQDLYKTLNDPGGLKGWRLDVGSDPCGESWVGVSCSESSIIYLKLQGLNLSGHLNGELYNLFNLKQLDLSSNKIVGKVPFVFPPNATHINMACNYLTGNIPDSVCTMKSLGNLNLSHNLLSGPVGNILTGLQNLTVLDLSFNNFTGDLPSSFRSLSNLTGLYLRNNRFTGSVTSLVGLPLTHLDIQDNHFGGMLPNTFHSIPNLWIGGNDFHAGDNNSSHRDFPLESKSIPQATRRKIMIVVLIFGGLLVASGVAVYMGFRSHSSNYVLCSYYRTILMDRHNISVKKEYRIGRLESSDFMFVHPSDKCLIAHRR